MVNTERHSAGTRCYLGLAGEGGHPNREGMKAGKKRCSSCSASLLLWWWRGTSLTVMTNNKHTWSEAGVLSQGGVMGTDVNWRFLLLAELVEEDLGIERAFPWFFHVLEEEEHGSSQGLWTGQCYCQWTLKYEENELLQLINQFQLLFSQQHIGWYMNQC